MKLVGITVSTRYTDFLTLCLGNARMMDLWVIVTDPDDRETIDLVRSHEKIHLLFHPLWGPRFDKSGAIRKAQEYVHAAEPKSWVLLVDSDIVLPVGARQVMERCLPPVDDATNRLWSVQRELYEDPDAYLHERPQRVEELMHYGFFQLYADKNKWYSTSSRDASACDVKFRDLFCGHETLPFRVKHLGETARNWKGRVTKPFLV